MKFDKAAAAATCAALALSLTACGGGGANTTPKASISAVKVFGDSLADSGTFGYKFTVQGSDVLIYPERVAAAYGKTLCNYFASTDSTANAYTTNSSCGNFAIGGGRINYASDSTDPRGILLQLSAAASQGFSSKDLLVIDGGGNDAADLISYYLAAVAGSTTNYVTLLSSVLTSAQVSAAVAAGSSGLQSAGVSYMQTLADNYYASIKSNALDNGVQHVVVVNIPSVTKTPRFLTVLSSLSSAYGSTVATQFETLFNTWVSAFNTELASKFSGDSRVAVVDLYTAMNAEVAAPAQYSLTNVTTPACPATGTDSSGLPTYDFTACTQTYLAANLPSGSTDTNWWKTYLFADSFHPTPYGHQLMYQLVAKSLATQGWL